MDQSVAIADVFDVVTRFYGVSATDIRSTRRSAQVHNARCAGIYLAYKAGKDVAEIRKAFGRRDPAIIAHICRAMAHRDASDRRSATTLARLMRACEGLTSRRAQER